MDALVTDYMDAERVDKAEATVKIKELITKFAWILKRWKLS